MSLYIKTGITPEDDYSDGGKIKKAGVYGFKVIESAIKKSKAGTDYLGMKVMLYDEKEEICKSYLNLFYNSDKDFCKQCIDRFLTITGENTLESAEQMINKYGLIGVKLAEFENQYGDIKVGVEIQPTIMFRHSDKASASEIINKTEFGLKFKEASAMLEKAEIIRLKRKPEQPTSEPSYGTSATSNKDDADLPF